MTEHEGIWPKYLNMTKTMNMSKNERTGSKYERNMTTVMELTRINGTSLNWKYMTKMLECHCRNLPIQLMEHDQSDGVLLKGMEHDKISGTWPEQWDWLKGMKQDQMKEHDWTNGRNMSRVQQNCVPVNCFKWVMEKGPYLHHHQGSKIVEDGRFLFLPRPWNVLECIVYYLKRPSTYKIFTSKVQY